MAELIGRDLELAQLLRILASDGPSGAVVAGAAGVGKSRLVRELVDAVPDDWHVERLVGAPGLREIPFGVVSHLLTDRLPDDPSQLLRSVRATFRLRSRGRPLLLTVDDAHELDEGSAGLLHQMVVHGEARAAMTMRPSARPPRAITALWKDEHVERIDLKPLTEAETALLASAVIGGPVDDDAAHAAWGLTRGHPLYVVVAMEAARASGAVTEDAGRWRLSGPLASSRLVEVISGRLEELTLEVRRALEVVAIAEPVPGHLLAEMVEDELVSELRSLGLVEVLHHDRGTTVTVVHPLFAEATVSEMGPGRSKEIAGQLVEVVGKHPMSEPGLRLRAAKWMVDAAVPVDSALATDGAREALRRVDYALAERLARAAAAVAPDPGAVVVLARALGFQGRGAEALQVLDEALAVRPDDRAEVALTRGHTLAFVMGRPSDAARALDEAAADEPETVRWRLDGERALYSAIAGDFAATIDAATAALANVDTPSPTRLAAHVNLSLAQAMTGRLERFDELAEEGDRLADAHRTELPLAHTQIGLNRASAWTCAGRLPDTEHMCHERVRRSEESGTVDPLWLAWRGLALGMQGRFTDAIHTQTRALAAFEEADPFRLRAQTVGILSMHQAQAARVPVDIVTRLARAAEEAGDETRLAVWVGRARAWVEARADPDVAASISLDAGRSSLSHGHVAWGIWALHDAVRWGGAQGVVDDLIEAAATTRGAVLLEAMADHARAVVAHDSEMLADVATRMAISGSPLYAAEAWAQLAARHHEIDREGVFWRRAAVRAELLLRECDGVATPAVQRLPQGLTERELEVALLASTGDTSRDVADRLFVSTRTIDNHLRHVYRKLGFTSRDELAHLLNDAVPTRETQRGNAKHSPNDSS